MRRGLASTSGLGAGVLRGGPWWLVGGGGLGGLWGVPVWLGLRTAASSAVGGRGAG